MSWLFIRASNQQFDQDIAASLQFCDSRRDAITSTIWNSLSVRGCLQAVTSLSREHRKEMRDEPRRGESCRISVRMPA
jgi:hypothetical protein